MNYKNLITIYFALNVTEGLFSNRFFYVVIQIFKRFLYYINKLHYLCNQEVEEEASSAEEQLASNRLPALRRNTLGTGRLSCPLYLCYGYRFMAKKT